MTIYYSLISLIILIGILVQGFRDYNLRTKIIITVSSVGIILVQGLRHPSIGTDIQSYLIGFRLSKNMNFFSGETLFNFEIGYSIFSQFIAKLGVGENQFLFIVASAIILPIMFTIGKKSKMPLLSIVIYMCLGFFLFSFSALRQSIAFSITFFSFKYIVNRNLKKFIISILLATLFHKTAIIFIFAYFLYEIQIKGKHLIFIFGSFFIIGVFRERIFTLIHIIYMGYPPIIESTGAYTMLVIMLIVYFGSYILARSNQKDISFNAYRNYLLMAIAIQIFASISNTIMRAGFYYYIFLILLIPDLIKQQDNRYFRFLITMISIFIALAFFQFQAGSGYLNITPYKFFWN